MRKFELKLVGDAFFNIFVIEFKNKNVNTIINYDKFINSYIIRLKVIKSNYKKEKNKILEDSV